MISEDVLIGSVLPFLTCVELAKIRKVSKEIAREIAGLERYREVSEMCAKPQWKFQEVTKTLIDHGELRVGPKTPSDIVIFAMMLERGVVIKSFLANNLRFASGFGEFRTKINGPHPGKFTPAQMIVLATLGKYPMYMTDTAFIGALINDKITVENAHLFKNDSFVSWAFEYGRPDIAWAVRDKLKDHKMLRLEAGCCPMTHISKRFIDAMKINDCYEHSKRIIYAARNNNVEVARYLIRLYKTWYDSFPWTGERDLDGEIPHYQLIDDLWDEM